MKRRHRKPSKEEIRAEKQQMSHRDKLMRGMLESFLFLIISVFLYGVYLFAVKVLIPHFNESPEVYQKTFLILVGFIILSYALSYFTNDFLFKLEEWTEFPVATKWHTFWKEIRRKF